MTNSALSASELKGAQAQAAQPQRRQRSSWAQARASLSRAKWPLFAIGFLVLLSLCALTANVIAPADPNRQNLILRLQPPMTEAQVAGHSFRFILGSDGLGRDVLSRLIYGSRVSLMVGLAAVMIGGFLGILFGVLGGYFGGFPDDVIMRLADIQLAFPFILLAIMVLVILGPGLVNLVIVLAIGQWVVYARIARGETISQKRRDYVESARAIGVQDGRILSRAILPNIIAPLVVIASFNVAAVILSEAALSFLGLGVPPEVPTWGGMLAESRDQLLGGYLVAGRLPRRGHHAHRALAEHPGRLAARFPRPAPARPLNHSQTWSINRMEYSADYKTVQIPLQYVPAAELRALTSELLRSTDLAPADADIIADALVTSELRNLQGQGQGVRRVRGLRRPRAGAPRRPARAA